MLIGRVDGPFTLRLLVQPTVAAILAIRAGLRDARENRPPYLWSIFTSPATRHDLLRQGLADVGKAFVVAVILDLTDQLIVYRWVYPGQALDRGRRPGVHSVSLLYTRSGHADCASLRRP